MRISWNLMKKGLQLWTCQLRGSMAQKPKQVDRAASIPQPNVHKQKSLKGGQQHLPTVFLLRGKARVFATLSSSRNCSSEVDSQSRPEQSQAFSSWRFFKLSSRVCVREEGDSDMSGWTGLDLNTPQKASEQTHKSHAGTPKGRRQQRIGWMQP